MQFVIQHLKKSFGRKPVLNDVDFTFEEGKIYGLLGRNGADKTTLFNCINRDLTADGGGFHLEQNGIRQEVLPEDIGYVLSVPTVPDFLTGREFLKFLLEINEEVIENRQSIDAYFDLMHSSAEDRDKLLKDYSHGMKNKMHMLLHLIAKPRILLLDEPLTSLDVVAAEEMKQFLRSLKQDRITIVSTHLMDLALDLCDESVLLSHGHAYLRGQSKSGQPGILVNVAIHIPGSSPIRLTRRRGFMVMSWIWTAVTALSILCAALTGQGSALGASVLQGTQAGVTLAVSMAGSICLWSGVGKLMEAAGLTDRLSRLMQPGLHRIFPSTKQDRMLARDLSANICANLLGLGNAATPMGIQAARRLNRDGTANDELCRLIVLNTASIQLIPGNVAAVRSALGCAAPFDILPAVWVSSLCSAGLGVTAAWALGRVWKS